MNSATDQLKIAILQQIAAVPAGYVSSYGDIAKAVGYPSHSRFVGSILKTLPKETKVPWHRIVNSQGKISFPIDSPAFKEQKKRLENEGVVILKGKIAKQFFFDF